MIADTGLLFAANNRRDGHHRASVDFLTECPETVLVPQLVFAEAANLLQRAASAAKVAFLCADFVTGDFISEPVHAADWQRIAELVVQYADLPLSAVDASIVAAAERLGVTRIATFDRRDFTVVRPRHIDAFELLP